MGFLIYSGADYEFEDRTLAHVKTAVSQRLRRQESFFLSWSNSVEKGSGRVSLWISPSIPLIFKFSGSRSPILNKNWLEAMRKLSHTPRGLVVLTEDEAEAFLLGRNEQGA